MRVLSIFALVLACTTAHAQHHFPVNPKSTICSLAIQHNIACIVGVTDNPHFHNSTILTGTAPVSMPWQGNTIATIEAQFPVVINWEFQTESAATLNAQMTLMDDLALARFSHAYWVESNGNLSTIMMYAAAKLSAANLVRWKSAFGAAATDAAVVTYAPLSVQSQYRATPASRLIPQSHAAYSAAGKLSRTVNAMPTGLAAPNVYMAPYEIFNEFLFTSAQTELGALALTAKFMSAEVGWAATVGWEAGGKFYAFMSWIDPSYGYDLFTTYGDLQAADFGPITGIITGTGYVDLPGFYDVTVWCIPLGCN